MKNCLFILLLLFAFVAKAQLPKKVDIKPEYTFNASMTYKMVNTNKKGKANEIVQKWYFSSSGLFGSEMEVSKGQKVRSVVDYKNKTTIMLMDEQKMAMGLSTDYDRIASEVSKDSGYKKPVKTGKTKTILGYNCNEWVSESDDWTTSMWVSETMPIASQGFYEVMTETFKKQRLSMAISDMKGMMLEMNGTSKKDGSTFSMICTEMNPNQTTAFSTAGYRTF